MDKAVLGGAVGGGISLIGKLFRPRSNKKSGSFGIGKGVILGGLIAVLPSPFSSVTAAAAALLFTASLVKRKGKSKQLKGQDVKCESEKPSPILNGIDTEHNAPSSVEDIPPVDKIDPRELPPTPQVGIAKGDETVRPETSNDSLPTINLHKLSSPFSTAPNSPNYTPKSNDSLFHDASPDLNSEDLNGGDHLDGSSSRPRSMDFTNLVQELTKPSGIESKPDSLATDAKSSASNDSKLPNGTKSPSLNDDAIRVLLARARAASQRVEDMHANILKLVNNSE